MEQNTGQIAANLPLMPAFFRTLQKQLPPFPKIHSYLTGSLRSSHEGSLTRDSGFCRVHEEGDTPLGTFPVRKTIDVDVNEETRANNDTTWPPEKRFDNHSASATAWV